MHYKVVVAVAVSILWQSGDPGSWDPYTWADLCEQVAGLSPSRS